MSKEKLDSVDSRRRGVVLFSAVIILVLAFSVLILHSPPGMETGAALLLVTPFAMCIVIAEASTLAARYAVNRNEK